MFKKSIFIFVNCWVLFALSLSMVFAAKTYKWIEESQIYTIVINWDGLKEGVAGELNVNTNVEKFYRENIEILEKAQEMLTSSPPNLPALDSGKISRWLGEQLQARKDIANFLGQKLESKLGVDGTISDEALAVEIYLFAHAITDKKPPLSFINRLSARLNGKAVYTGSEEPDHLKIFLRGFIQVSSGKLQPTEAPDELWDQSFAVSEMMDESIPISQMEMSEVQSPRTMQILSFVKDKSQEAETLRRQLQQHVHQSSLTLNQSALAIEDLHKKHSFAQKSVSDISNKLWDKEQELDKLTEKFKSVNLENEKLKEDLQRAKREATHSGNREAAMKYIYGNLIALYKSISADDLAPKHQAFLNEFLQSTQSIFDPDDYGHTLFEKAAQNGWKK